MKAAVWPSETHDDPSVNTSLLVSAHCSESLAWHPTSATPLILGPHWDSWISYHSLVSWRCCSPGSAGLALHMLEQHIDELGVGMEYLAVLVLGLGGSWVGQPASFPHHHHLGKLPSTAEASSSNFSDSKEQGFSCFPSLFIDLLQITISTRKWRPLQVKDITTVIIGF